MSEWVSVKDRMPEIDAQVWISFKLPWDNESGQGYAIYLGGNDWFWDVSETGDLLSRSEALKNPENTVCDITHWQPLPPPPAE